MEPLIIVGTGIAAANGIVSLTAIGLASIALNATQKPLNGGTAVQRHKVPRHTTPSCATPRFAKPLRSQSASKTSEHDPRLEFMAKTEYVPESAPTKHYDPKSFDNSMFHVPEHMKAIAEHADHRLERDFHIRGGIGGEIMADRDMSEFYGNENAVAPIGHREEFMKFLYKEEIEAAADSDPYALEIKPRN